MESILLCYNRFTALQIEISILISSIIGIICTFLGLIYIPFEIDSKIYKILFISNFPLSFIIIIISLILIIFRLKYMINNTYNIYFYGISFGLIIICMTQLILNLVNNSLIINNMYYNDYFAKFKKYKNIKKLTKSQGIKSIIIIIILLINFFSLILLSLSDNLRINLQIDGSYNDYLKAVKLEEEYAKNKSKIDESELTQDLSINSIGQNKKEKDLKSSQINLKNDKDISLEIKVDNNNVMNKKLVN